MAMMITKFHRLIQSKILWILFLIIVVISFVLVTAPDSVQNAAQKRKLIAGKLNGKKVLRDEYDLQRRLTSFAYRESDYTSDELDEITWSRIAKIQEAEKLGFKASDEDVNFAITKAFEQDGKFSEEIYNSFRIFAFREYGIGLRGIDMFIRQQIILNYIQRLIAGNVLLSPFESRYFFKNLNDVFTIEFITFTSNPLEDQAGVDDEQLLEYYEENKESFKIPEQVKVRYIDLPINNYTNDFTNEVKKLEEKAQEIYDNNPESFVKELEPDPEDTNAPALSLLTTNLTFEEAKSDILADLIWNKARSKARDAGGEVAIVVAQENPDFDAVCAERGFEVKTSPFFSKQGSVPGIDASIGLGSYAFTLSTNKDDRVSDALLGSNAVYVIYLEEKKPKRIPPLEEIKEQVSIQANYYYTQERMFENANQARDEVLAAVKNGATFSNAVSKLEKMVLTSPPFSFSGEENTFEFARYLSRDISSLEEGEISEIISIPNGLLLCHVLKREDADWGQYEEFRERILESYLRSYTPTVFKEYDDYLLKKSNFESRLNLPETEKETEEESEE